MGRMRGCVGSSQNRKDSICVPVSTAITIAICAPGARQRRCVCVCVWGGGGVMFVDNHGAEGGTGIATFLGITTNTEVGVTTSSILTGCLTSQRGGMRRRGRAEDRGEQELERDEGEGTRLAEPGVVCRQRAERGGGVQHGEGHAEDHQLEALDPVHHLRVRAPASVVPSGNALTRGQRWSKAVTPPSLRCSWSTTPTSPTAGGAARCS